MLLLILSLVCYSDVFSAVLGQTWLDGNDEVHHLNQMLNL